MFLYSEARLASARRGKAEDGTDDDVPSTSGRQYSDAADVSKVWCLEYLLYCLTLQFLYSFTL